MVTTVSELIPCFSERLNVKIHNNFSRSKTDNILEKTPLYSGSIGLPHHHIYRETSTTLHKEIAEVFNEEYFLRMLPWQKRTKFDGVVQLR